MTETARDVHVRPRGGNSFRLPPREKIRFYVGRQSNTSVADDFPLNATLEVADFTPALHHETIDLLAHAQIRPPSASLLVVRLYPGKNPRDEQMVLSIEDEEGELEDCFTAKVGEHSHEADEEGYVDFPFLLTFGDPVELPSGAPFEGLNLVDVSTGSWESCPSELVIRGGSWEPRRLQVHQFNLEVERF